VNNKTVCANKVSDFTTPFMRNMASKMQLMLVLGSTTLPRPTGRAYNTESMHSAVMKMLHGSFVHMGKTLTDVQILGCQLHPNAFGDRAPCGQAGG